MNLQCNGIRMMHDIHKDSRGHNQNHTNGRSKLSIIKQIVNKTRHDTHKHHKQPCTNYREFETTHTCNINEQTLHT